jgi:GT2 family glycosyltransferase
LSVCLRSLKDVDAEVIIFDDHSPEEREVVELAEQYGYTYSLAEENRGFSKNVNRGLELALKWKRDAILCNADIEFTDKNWLQELLASEGDIIGAKLLYPNHIIQHGGIYFSPITRTFDHRYKGAPSNLPAANEQADCPVTAALQLIRYSTLEKLGLYDEAFKMGHEDVDYGIRALETGLKCVYQPKCVAVHHEHMFRGNESEKMDEWQRDSLMTLFKKHSGKSFFGLLPTMHE